MHPRQLLLTVASLIPVAIGSLALLAPAVLLVDLKGAETSPAAETMARTAGVLLVSVGVVSFLARRAEDSPALRAILAGNLVLQLMIVPIDPLAWLSGAFHGLGSFVPNTVLHVVLALAFGHALWRLRGDQTKNVVTK